MAARYLYCLIDTTAADPDEETLDAAGVDDERVRTVTVDGVGAVVHDCDGLYDSDDPATVQTWLLDHQRVVDAATEAFGTPLPVRFDTVIEGDDDDVRAWLADELDRVRPALRELRGHREYRVEARWDSDPFEQRVRATDDRLAEIERERDDAGAGEGFLRETQYETRLRELRSERRVALAAALRETVAPHAVELTERDPDRHAAVAADAADADERPDPERVRVVTLAALVERDDETALGRALDDYVDANDGVEVRFTGPWAPYTFAPELG